MLEVEGARGIDLNKSFIKTMSTCFGWLQGKGPGKTHLG